MKKSSKSPKDVQKDRVIKNIIMKIPLSEQNFIYKENYNPKVLPSVQKREYKNQGRKLENEYIHNPFDLPNHLRIFQLRSKTKKLKAEPYIVSGTRTICDIDNTFYKAIEGRPIRQFTDVKVYMRNIRDITLCKANTAYLKDQNIQIETSFTDEVKEYNKVEKLFINSKMNFARFVEDSYVKAKALQAKAEETSIELVNKINELEVFSFEYVKLRNQLVYKTATFETLTMYRKFLNSISPNEWRKRYDNFIDCKYLFPINDKTTDVTSLSEVKTSSSEDATSLSEISLDKYKRSIAKLQSAVPNLYFKEPAALMNIYDNLRRQCLNYMKIEVFSNNILTSVIKSKEYLQTYITIEFNDLEGLINNYKAHVIWIENREIECKTLFENLVMDKIESLYASYDITKLFTCVQYVNSRLFGSPEDPKDSLTFLIKHIESLYIGLTSALDCLNQDIVKSATRELFTEDIGMMKQAHIAQRTIKECDILSKALYTSYEPPRFKRK